MGQEQEPPVISATPAIVGTIIVVAAVLFYCMCHSTECILCKNMVVIDLKFKPGIPDIFNILGTFFLITLVVERSLEVFVGALREPKAMKIELEIRAGEKGEFHRLEYQNTTRSLTLGIGMIFGVLVSASGFRILKELVVGDPGGLFLVVDVFISGLFISGGSNSVHRLITVYDELTNLARKTLVHKGGNQTPG